METDLKISICVPCYEMKGFGVKFLDFSLQKIFNQSYKNIEVIISDHSQNNNISNLINTWNNKLDIKYLLNNKKIGNSSANLNNTIVNATGDIIKILFQDDFLYDNNSLVNIINSFKNNNYWSVSSSEHSNDGVNFYHTMIPSYHDKIHFGVNTISSPSVLAFKNKDIELFDENLIWLMDVEYYKRLYNKHGLPIVIPQVTVVNRTWNGQISSLVTQDIKNNELQYITKKYYNYE